MTGTPNATVSKPEIYIRPANRLVIRSFLRRAQLVSSSVTEEKYRQRIFSTFYGKILNPSCANILRLFIKTARGYGLFPRDENHQDNCSGINFFGSFS